MKILTFSTLYPNAARPNHGIFVETRLRHLLQSGSVEARVVAPVPWFPSSNPRYGRYAAFARAPRQEQRHSIDVMHPRYVSIPAIGMSAAPFLLAAGARSAVDEIVGQGYDFDLIDAHYFYPDGVAAVILGQRLNRPVIITARGTDLNLIPEHALPRRMIQWAARRAAGLITVCKALKDSLVDLGVGPERIQVLRNGVDLKLFRPTDRNAERARLGLAGTILLSVGGLTAHKGHDLVIRALGMLPNARLLIAGEGQEAGNLRRLAETLNLTDRVTFLGPVAHSELRCYYGAADALVLASSREGWANVLLEAMACGTPVVASNVWGTPEVVAAREAGVLMTERTAHGVVEALNRLFSNYPDRNLTRRYAERFSWDDTTRGQLALFGRILQRSTI